MAQFVEHSPDYRLGRLSFTKIFSALSILVFLSLLLISLNYKLSALVMPGYISYDVKRVSEIIILMLAVTVIGVSRKHQYYWLSQWMLLPQAARYLLFSVFVIGIISSWIAPMPRMAFMEVALYAALFVWVFFVAAQQQVWKASVDFIWVLCISIAALFYLATYFFSYYELMVLHKPLKHFPGFLNIRFFSQLQVWTLPVISLLLVRWKQKLPFFLKSISFLLVVLWWAIAFQSGTKGLFLALAMSLFFVFVLFKKTSLPWLRTQIFFMILGVLVYGLVFCWLPGLLGQHSLSVSESMRHYIVASHVSVKSRLYLWHQAWMMIKSKMVLGVGPLHYAYYPNAIGAHPHNSLLMIASEWGVPVTVFMVFLASWGFCAWCRYARQSPSFTNIALTVSLLAGLLYSLVSGVMVMPLSQLMMGLIIGWMLGHYFFEQPIKVSMVQRFALMCALLLLFTVAAWIMIPQIQDLPNAEGRWIMSRSMYFGFQPSLNPRFWTQGWLR